MTPFARRPIPPALAALARLCVGWAACLGLLLLATPLVARVAAGEEALRFLVEFLSDGVRPWLTAASGPPVRAAARLAGGVAADVWRPSGEPPYPPLVLVHGLTPDGKDDPRLAATADRLARAGFLVTVPDLPGLRAERLDPEDSRAVAAALAQAAGWPGARGAPAVVAVSVGVAPALAAAAGRAVRVTVAVGGYAEARELVRYFTTGAYGLDGIAGRARVHPELARAFLAANLELIRDPADRAAVAAALAGRPLAAGAGHEARAVLAVLENRDPARVDALLDALPAETRARLEALSPARRVREVAGRLLLVHGRGDPAVPFTESVRLARAADPARTRLVLVGLLAHVEGRAAGAAYARDLAVLWSVVYELCRG